ncbi:MAG: DUF6691 family protein [Vicinamibacterales bacterium]
MHARRTIAVGLATGIIFGFGLAWSTMVEPEVVLDFLRWRDFGLLLVLGGAVTVTAVVYALLPRLRPRPLFAEAYGRHAASLNRDTLAGAALFGVGWGLSGVCPGPAIAGLGVGNFPLLWALGGLFLGAYVHGRVAGGPARPPE